MQNRRQFSIFSYLSIWWPDGVTQKLAALEISLLSKANMEKSDPGKSNILVTHFNVDK